MALPRQNIRIAALRFVENVMKVFANRFQMPAQIFLTAMKLLHIDCAQFALLKCPLSRTKHSNKPTTGLSAKTVFIFII